MLIHLIVCTEAHPDVITNEHLAQIRRDDSSCQIGLSVHDPIAIELSDELTLQGMGIIPSDEEAEASLRHIEGDAQRDRQIAISILDALIARVDLLRMVVILVADRHILRLDCGLEVLHIVLYSRSDRERARRGETIGEVQPEVGRTPRTEGMHLLHWLRHCWREAPP